MSCVGSFSISEFTCPSAVRLTFRTPYGEICDVVDFKKQLPNLKTIELYAEEYCECVCVDETQITLIGCKVPSTW